MGALRRTSRAALAAGVMAASVALASGSAVAVGQASAGGDDANITRVDTAPPPRSAFDKQLIRRDGSTGNSLNSTSATKPASAGTARPATQKTTVRPAMGFETTRVAAALLAVLALIFALRWLFKRFGVAGVARSTRAVQVLSRSPVSPRQSLVLLRVGRRIVVCADGAGQMSTLTEITDPDEVAALIGQIHEDHAGRAGASFGPMFGKMRKRYDDDDDVAADESGGSEAHATEAEPLTLRRGTVDDEVSDPAVTSARRELSGLMDRVRSLSSQFKGQ